MKLAAIDVGSNAIRMAIGFVNGDSPLKVIERVREPVRLGEDVFTKGSISDETTERAIEAFIRFRKLLYKHEVKQVRALATSALREAHNRDIFIDRISQTSGIDIQVISGEEEARLIHLAVSSVMNLENQLALMIDIGGGSVEITLVSNGKITASESFNMGTVRMLQKLEEKKTGQRQFNQLVREYVGATKKRIKKEIGNQKIDLCIGTGGNVESLGDLREQFFDKGNGSISKDELETIVQKLQQMSFDERIQKLRMLPDRADVIMPATIVLQKVMKLAGVNDLSIPRVGLKEGILLSMAQELVDTKAAKQTNELARAAALQVGRKYSFDEEHGTAVAKFAVQLFDETQEIHKLGEESRMLLEIASLLHDVGHFINIVGHHKHTYYLLTATPILGLTDPQRGIVANVARYHRKADPTLQHESYRSLSPKDRVIVTKLAALLRIADSLDTEHATRVTRISTEYKKPQFIFHIEGNGDLLLEKWALLKRAHLFEEVFGVKVSING